MEIERHDILFGVFVGIAGFFCITFFGYSFKDVMYGAVLANFGFAYSTRKNGEERN